MKILYEVPDKIVQFCRVEKKLSDKITRLFIKSYLDFKMGSTAGWNFDFDEFKEWFEDEGEDALEAIKEGIL